MTSTDATGLRPCFQGSVNTWECDENDHLNVRFYAHKINQAIQAWVAESTGDPALTGPALGAIRGQHIRFLREARAATPLRIDCGALAPNGMEGARLTLLSLMHDNATGTPLAAFQTVLDTGGWASRIRPASFVEAPDHARPRGLDPAALPAPPDSMRDALDAGYRIVGRGVIGAEECDAGGDLLPHVYIGRVSDSMPNLWVFVNGEADRSARANGEMGGAALEYHLGIREPLRRGDVYTQLSGIHSIGSKTQTMAHVLINERTGHCAASAAAVGVAMDLETRRAVLISDERRARLEKLLLRA